MMVVWYEDKSKYADVMLPVKKEARFLLKDFCNDNQVTYSQAIIYLIIEYYRQRDEMDKLVTKMKACDADKRRYFSDEWIEKLTGARL